MQKSLEFLRQRTNAAEAEKVKHGITAHLVVAIAEAAGHTREPQQARRLHRAARNDDETCFPRLHAWVIRIRNVEIADAGRAARGFVVDNLERFGIGVDLRVRQVLQLLQRGGARTGLRPLTAPAQVLTTIAAQVARLAHTPRPELISREVPES